MKKTIAILFSRPVNTIPAILLCALIISAAMAFPARAAERVDEVTAIGTSAITGGNLASARQNAIDDALKNALMKSVAELVALPAAIERLQALTEQVFSIKGGFVRDYSVLREGRTDATFSVAVSASILRDELKASLNKAGLEDRQTSGKNKKLLAIIAGQDGLDEAVKSAAQESVIPLGLSLDGPERASYETGNIGVLTWSDVGRQRQADYVALISARKDCEKSGAPPAPCAVKGSIKIIDVADKSLVAYEEFTAEKQPADDTLASALSRKLNDIMAKSFDKSALSAATKATFFKIVLLDVKNYQQYDQIRKALRDAFPGVTDVRLDSATANEFTLAVKYRGSLDELESELLKHAFPQFELTPAKSGEGSASFQIKNRSAAP